MEEAFQRVEKVLANFSEEARRNYEMNKKTVTIDFFSEQEKEYSQYLPASNKIELTRYKDLDHELFHMAFQDFRKYQTEIYPNVFLENGVSFQNAGQYMISNKALTEGFANSLAKKARENSAYPFETFIVELLVAIYGEKIYEFPLQNDPLGFIKFCSNHIVEIGSYLDRYYIDYFFLLSFVSCTKICQTLKDTKEIKRQFKKLELELLSSVLKTIKAVIWEYQSCRHPSTTREEFQREVEKFYQENDFLLIYVIARNNQIDLKKEVEKMIEKELLKEGYLRKIGKKIKILS